MSGGSMDYVYLHIKEAAELTEDETIAQLLMDLSKVLHDEEWADCCDISDEEYQDTLLKFKRKWLEQEPKTEWIPVSERLPEDHDWYLIVVKEKSTGYQYIPRVASHFRNNEWCLINTENADKDWLDDLECIAWCPLPEPYKAESEG